MLFILMLYFTHVVEVHKLLKYCAITPHFATNVSNKPSTKENRVTKPELM